jgi:hypothetical protein
VAITKTDLSLLLKLVQELAYLPDNSRALVCFGGILFSCTRPYAPYAPPTLALLAYAPQMAPLPVVVPVLKQMLVKLGDLVCVAAVVELLKGMAHSQQHLTL